MQNDCEVLTAQVFDQYNQLQSSVVFEFISNIFNWCVVSKAENKMYWCKLFLHMALGAKGQSHPEHWSIAPAAMRWCWPLAEIEQLNNLHKVEHLWFCNGNATLRSILNMKTYICERIKHDTHSSEHLQQTLPVGIIEASHFPSSQAANAKTQSVQTSLHGKSFSWRFFTLSTEHSDQWRAKSFSLTCCKPE